MSDEQQVAKSVFSLVKKKKPHTHIGLVCVCVCVQPVAPAPARPPASALRPSYISSSSHSPVLGISCHGDGLPQRQAAPCGFFSLVLQNTHQIQALQLGLETKFRLDCTTIVINSDY